MADNAAKPNISFNYEEIEGRLLWWEDHEGIWAPDARADLRSCLDEINRLRERIDKANDYYGRLNNTDRKVF